MFPSTKALGKGWGTHERNKQAMDLKREGAEELWLCLKPSGEQTVRGGLGGGSWGMQSSVPVSFRAYQTLLTRIYL